MYIVWTGLTGRLTGAGHLTQAPLWWELIDTPVEKKKKDEKKKKRKPIKLSGIADPRSPLHRPDRFGMSAMYTTK